MNFSDTPKFVGLKPLREWMELGGPTDPDRVLEITQAVTLVFFDQHLKGEKSTSLDSLVTEYSELQHIMLP
ncbi:MAG: hypothetical protein FWF02_14965 [Micrococcales bacterium]|nr:hypothetical protein [Micrococcales bacterium]MCL2668980.1 hypothetical protein [Micrococcales bacterium]